MNPLAFALALTVQSSIVLHLNAPPAVAFPLFDPVNETKWDPYWKPQLLGDHVQEGLVFLTQDDRGRAVWLLDRYDANANAIRYVVTGQNILDQIDIKVAPSGSGASVATVTYTRTSLDSSADEQVKRFGAHFAHQAPHWEAAINGALAKIK